MTYTKASVEQHLDLATKYWAKSVSPEEVMLDLKAHSYKLDNYIYEASRVATAVAMVYRINNAIQSGKLKATKAKGLHI